MDKPVAVQNADAYRAKPVPVRGDGYIGVIFPADSKELPGLYPKSASYWIPSELDVLVAVQVQRIDLVRAQAF